MKSNTITLYRTHPVQWEDPWGSRHPAIQICERVLATLAGTFPVDNGYETYRSLCAVGGGYTFVKRVPIDFGGRVFWYEAVTKTFWYERLSGRVIDEHGDTVTA